MILCCRDLDLGVLANRDGVLLAMRRARHRASAIRSIGGNWDLLLSDNLPLLESSGGAKGASCLSIESGAASYVLGGESQARTDY